MILTINDTTLTSDQTAQMQNITPSYARLGSVPAAQANSWMRTADPRRTRMTG